MKGRRRKRKSEEKGSKRSRLPYKMDAGASNLRVFRTDVQVDGSAELVPFFFFLSLEGVQQPNVTEGEVGFSNVQVTITDLEVSFSLTLSFHKSLNASLLDCRPTYFFAFVVFLFVSSFLLTV